MRKYMINNWQKIAVGCTVALIAIVAHEHAIGLAGLFPFIGETKKDGADPEKDGKSDPNPADGGDKNIKNLQRKLSERDKELKTAMAEIEKLKKNNDANKDEVSKKIDELLEHNKNLTKEIAQINKEKRITTLSEKYPDIAPELIIDKNDDEIEKIVAKQREIAKKQYGDSQYFLQPQYSDEAQIQNEIKEVQKDSSLTGDQKAEKVMSLTRMKNKLFGN